MSSQKSKAKQIFNQLGNFGFHPIDIKYGNGYFIFEHGKDMVIHFHIKECKGWLFGIWWNLNDKNQFDFFTQYERDIDKFKPSASCFVRENIEYDKKDLERELRWEVLPILKFIRNHPYVAWSYDGGYPRDCWQYKTDWEARIEFWKYSLYLKKKERINKKINKKYKKLVNEICKDRLIDYVILDENHDGVYCFPRFKVVCRGVMGEKLKPGCYDLDLKTELDEKTLEKVRKFDKKLNTKYKHQSLDIMPFEDMMNFWVVKKP